MSLEKLWRFYPQTWCAVDDQSCCISSNIILGTEPWPLCSVSYLTFQVKVPLLRRVSHTALQLSCFPCSFPCSVPSSQGCNVLTHTLTATSCTLVAFLGHILPLIISTKYLKVAWIFYFFWHHHSALLFGLRAAAGMGILGKCGERCSWELWACTLSPVLPFPASPAGLGQECGAAWPHFTPQWFGLKEP